VPLPFACSTTFAEPRIWSGRTCELNVVAPVVDGEGDAEGAGGAVSFGDAVGEADGRGLADGWADGDGEADASGLAAARAITATENTAAIAPIEEVRRILMAGTSGWPGRLPGPLRHHRRIPALWRP